jgi:hypothetical protein
MNFTFDCFGCKKTVTQARPADHGVWLSFSQHVKRDFVKNTQTGMTEIYDVFRQDMGHTNLCIQCFDKEEKPNDQAKNINAQENKSPGV